MVCKKTRKRSQWNSQDRTHRDCPLRRAIGFDPKDQPIEMKMRKQTHRAKIEDRTHAALPELASPAEFTLQSNRSTPNRENEPKPGDTAGSNPTEPRRSGRLQATELRYSKQMLRRPRDRLANPGRKSQGAAVAPRSHAGSLLPAREPERGEAPRIAVPTRAYAALASGSPADCAASRSRARSAAPSFTSGGRTTARRRRPCMTSTSFMRLCMSRNGAA